MADVQKRKLLSLLDRPREPIFFPKGEEGFVFNVPDAYLDERYKETDITNRFGGNKVDVKEITVPDLGVALQLAKTDHFSLFLPYHRRMAEQAINVFMGMSDLRDLESCAAYCQQNMNPMLFNYAYSVALIHRKDTRDIDLPPVSDYFPDKFMDGTVFAKAREAANINSKIPGNTIRPLEIPMDYTASDMEEEHRVAYFREDIGVNLHHWHWHLVYPNVGTPEIVAKNRRGELFYYMHQQMVARYNFERLSNKLARVTKLTDWREPIKEAYFPKMDSMSSSRTWPSRAPNTILRNINREVDQIVFDIQDMERWRDRLEEAVATSQVINQQGQRIPLTETEGIDILGNLVERSDISINPNLYGDLHNFGHLIIAFSHDPDFKHLETFGVMGDSTTAMRDPIFYRWHAFVDDIFQKHKNTLTAYTVQQLGFDGLTVTSAEVNSENSQTNQFTTFWKQDTINLTRGMDFVPRGDILATITHLQHVPFEYRIQVNNNGPQRQGTVRIFMAPKFDERGLPYLFRDHRKLMIELDKFVHTFQTGQNTVTRSSSKSSVIIPFERTFRNLDAAPTAKAALDAFNFCGCGWPEHMLIPKGSPEGMPAVLFVMVSDYQNDRVQQPATRNQNENGVSYCGLKDGNYPDRKPMGWPFDRQPRLNVDTLQQFLTPNMLTQDVTIKFENRGAPPPKRSITPKSGAQPVTPVASKPAAESRKEKEKPAVSVKPVEKKKPPPKKQDSVKYGSDEEEIEEEYE